jgi:hypothetical protein
LSWYRHVLKFGGLAGIAYGLSWVLIASSNSVSTTALAAAFVAGSLVFAAGAYFLIDSDLRATFLRMTRALAVPKGTSPPAAQ